MGGIKDSEAYKGLQDLFGKYKKFSFDGISQIPYGSVPAWIAFSDGRVEEALKEKRGLWQSVRDSYTLGLLGIVLSLVAFWYFALIFGGILLSIGALVGIWGLMMDAALTIGIIAALILVMLIGPGVFLLARGAFYHLIMKLFRGKGSYADTVSVIVFTTAANLVLMIPLYIAYALVVGFILGPLAYVVIIYCIYLQYRGMMHAHAMSSKDAAVATVAAIVLEFGAYAALYLAVSVGMVALAAIVPGQ
ncbi:YIP1 family protein [Candidatus Micrarchaeota archaeon]|nr:YIP1 family protein [Candidatus Micrarchaeota archaeon]